MTLSMFIRLPKDVITYIAKLIHEDYVSELNREYTSIVSPYDMDGDVNKAGIYIGVPNLTLYKFRTIFFRFNYRNLTSHNYTNLYSIYSIFTQGRYDIPKHYKYSSTIHAIVYNSDA